MPPTFRLPVEEIEEVCLIDDDNMALFLAEKILEFEMPNKPVKTFETVDDSLAYLQADHSKKRLIFVDLNMPKKDGWCFLENYPGTPENDLIFILSSSDNIADKSKAKTFKQVTDYLEKPMTIEVIAALLKKYK
jgi:response regulator of citrate/malate metabolism